MNEFTLINTALRAMQASQQALQTSAHNVANANTEGFSRQRVVLTPAPAYTAPGFNRPIGAGQVGMGVKVADIRRMRDGFLDYQIRQETTALGYWQSREDLLRQVEVVFSEPGPDGLNTMMARFWEGWQELAKNPESVPVRTSLVETAEALAAGLRHLDQSLEGVGRDQEQLLALEALELSSLARQLADLNTQIVTITGVGNRPNDLLDQRDRLLDQMARLADVNYSTTPSGAMTVTLGGRPLVQENTAFALGVKDQDGARVLVWAEDLEAVPLNGGELAALNNNTTEVRHFRQQLDALALGLSQQLNAIHAGGYDLEGNPVTGTAHEEFFLASGAGDLRVNPLVYTNPELLAAGLPGAGTPPYPPGNGDNALAMAQIQHAPQVYDQANNTLVGAPLGSSGLTMDEFYQDIIVRLGVAGQESGRMVTNQQALVNQMTNQREAVAGVSLDEEMTSLLAFQHAYEAAARVVATMDQLLDTIINRMGA